MSERGLSPVIATLLLITIALLLGAIIFLWAKAFIGEKSEKFNEPVENACLSVNFDAEAYNGIGTGTIAIVNKGNVPLYGIQIQKVKDGAIENLESARCKEKLGAGKEITINNGESCFITSNIEKGQEIFIIPVILGEKGNVREPYTCDRKYGRSLSVT